MNRISKWFVKFWARSKWVIITILALCVILPVTWSLLPIAKRIEINRSFTRMWNGFSNGFSTRWSQIMEALGIKSQATSGSHIPCSDNDVCSMAINRTFKPITLSDFKALLGNKNLKDLMVVDIRSVEDYEKGHIPIAFSIPYEDLKNYLAGVTRSTPLVIVGSGNENYKEIGKQLVDRWVFSNAGFLIGGMKAWDGDIEREK
jgi:rhodanese-related sulfurtransferase